LSTVMTPVARMSVAGPGAVRGVLAASVPVLSALVGLILVWALTSATGLVDSSVLPGPLTVLREAANMIDHSYGGHTLLGHIAISLGRVVAGFALGALVGLALGVGIAYARPLRYLLEPIIAFLRPIPPLAFITVFILWFGIGETPKIALIFLGVVVPMTISAAGAMEALHPDLEDAAACLGASRPQLLLHVRLPAALPDILIAMRLMLALAWTSVMGAELIAAQSGVGWTIWQASRTLNSARVIVGVIAIAVVGAIGDAVLIVMTRILTGGWRSKVRGE
jgi:taurine transport system permease protein